MSRKVHFSYQEGHWELERTVFKFGHTDPSLPRVIIISAMHGNEPSGLRALLELKPALRKLSAELDGMVCGLIGNFKALELGRRYVDADLNRMWNGKKKDPRIAEQLEKAELDALLQDLMAGSGPRFVLDLHTTSSESSPFMSIADTEMNRRFAAKFSIPAIAGIERFIKGALLEYVSDQGHVGLAFEAGQHLSADSVDAHREFVIEAMKHAGVLRSNIAVSGTEGTEYDIIHRHPVTEGDEFVMSPGYSNFSEIHKGQVLAHDRNGEIRAPKSGLLFMPLYQREGEDGFFIIR